MNRLVHNAIDSSDSYLFHSLFVIPDTENRVMLPTFWNLMFMLDMSQESSLHICSEVYLLGDCSKSTQTDKED